MTDGVAALTPASGTDASAAPIATTASAMPAPTVPGVEFGAPSPAPEQVPAAALNKMDLALRAALHSDSDAPLRVIMQLSSQRLTNAESLQRLEEAGVEVLGTGGFEPAVVARVRPTDLAGLAGDRAVVRLSLDAEVRTAAGQLYGRRRAAQLVGSQELAAGSPASAARSRVTRSSSR